MPVPTLVTDLSTTVASNSPAGSDNVFPSLDDYLRSLSGFIASIRDNSGNGWVSPYLPLTYSAGTANGVVYLNGSKVVTTGSGLVFDGTNLGIGTSSPGAKLHVKVGTNQNLLTTSTSSKVTNLAVDDAGSVYVDWQQYANQFLWFTASTQRMALDTSGNLGLGAVSPGNRFYVNGPQGVPQIRATDGNVDIYVSYSSGTGASAVNYFGTNSNHPQVFLTNNTERARITSGGDLLVGTGTAGAGAGFSTRLAIDAGAADAAIFKTSGGVSSSSARCWNSATTGDNLFLLFATEGTYTGRGSISYNRAGGLVAYNTTSDYRAKDIIGPVQDPGATIDALKVYEGKMKGATQSRPMLVAHEAQAVAPYCVTGEKDAVNEDGTPKFQQMDVSSLVPLLLAEIQSLRARVAALEAA